jgi:hypothetical protein
VFHFTVNISMLMPFIQYVSEARVVRRQNDLQRFTFQDIQERIYLTFLGLSLLKNINNEGKQWAKMYAHSTLTYGDFKIVRTSGNDLYNMLSVVDGKEDIVKKLRNPKQAEALRQRSTLPTLAVKRYLRKLSDDYDFLTKLENTLNISNVEYKNLRRSISDYSNLKKTDKNNVNHRMAKLLQNKLHATDITKKIKQLLGQ